MEASIHFKRREANPYKEYIVQYAYLFFCFLRILRKVKTRLEKIHKEFLWGGPKRGKFTL